MKHLGGLRFPSDTRIREIYEVARFGKNAEVVFHDLANHFTTLSLSISSLEQNLCQDHERMRKYLEQTKKTKQQIEYVADVLRTHLSGTVREIFKPKILVERLVGALSEKTGRSGIIIFIKIPDGLDIFGNKSAFTHIITNLILNSIESFDSLPHQKEKRICIKMWQKNDTYILVTDNGCGIHTAFIKKIFDGHFSTKNDGHGIGLSATRDCVETIFGGTIRVNSSQKETSFLITIPKKRRRPARATSPKTKA